MSLDAILLGFLERPASGYELKQAFDDTVRHFWSAELSQIYPTLHRLLQRGEVEVSIEPSTKGPDRKVYRRTPAGEEALLRWLTEGPVVKTERFGFLAQLFFLGQLGDESATRTFLQKIRAHFADRLALLRSVDEFHRREEPDYPLQAESEGFHAYLTLHCGIVRTEASVAWCDEALEMLERRQADPTASTGHRSA